MKRSMLSTAPTFTYTFGDSLSDSGVVFGLTDTLLIDPFQVPVADTFIDPAYDGVFSNGPVHTQVVAELLGATLEGYATGGARAQGTQPVLETISGFDDIINPLAPAEVTEFDLNIDAQVARFLNGDPIFPGAAVESPGDDDTVLAIYFAGANDLGDFAASVAANPLTAPLAIAGFASGIVETAGDQMAAIAESGQVDQLAVYTLPAIDFIPLPSDTNAFLIDVVNGLIDQINAGYEAAALQVGQATGVEVAIVDADVILSELDADPSTFGFLAKGPFYLGDGTDPDVELPGNNLSLPSVSFETNPAVDELPLRQIQFFDQLHPTTAVHSVLGSFAAATLTKDTLITGDGESFRWTQEGDDLALMRGGDDFLNLGRGDDVGLGGTGTDLIKGGAGTDIVSGGSGDDTVLGGRGIDFVAGGSGDDLVRGGSGRDILLDGLGDDVMRGNRGADNFVWIDPEILGGTVGTETIFGGRNFDTLWLVVEDGAALQAELDAQSGANGEWTLASAGITTRSVEAVQIIEGGIDALGDITVRDAELFADGLGWGFV